MAFLAVRVAVQALGKAKLPRVYVVLTLMKRRCISPTHKS